MKPIRRKRARNISFAAAMVLRIGLPAVLLSLIAFVRLFLIDRAKDPVLALYRYPAMLEYILLSLALVILGAFLFDYLSSQKHSPS